MTNQSNSTQDTEEGLPVRKIGLFRPRRPQSKGSAMTRDTEDVVDSAVAMIRTMDVHNAVTAMAERLKLNAEVRVCVGKWDERGSIVGWTKAGKTKEPASVLVEVFVSDLAGEDREFDKYARQVKRLLTERQSLSDRIDELKGALRLAGAHLTNAAAFAEGLGWLAVASEKREIAAEVRAALHQEGIAP